MESVPYTVIGLIAAIFAGFFALIRYIMTKQEKITNSFLTYIETKNGNLERVADNFARTTEKHHDTIKQVAVELGKLSVIIDRSHPDQ